MTVFMLLSCLLKQNMLIAAIAAAIVLCLAAMERRRWLPAFAVPVAVRVGHGSCGALSRHRWRVPWRASCFDAAAILQRSD